MSFKITSSEDFDLANGVSPLVEGADETKFETYMDIVLGLAFFITAIVAAKRMLLSRQQQNQGGGAETYVVTAFYSLIGATSILRTIWFGIPARVWQPSYVPIAVYAWDKEHPAWVGAMLSEMTVTAGSLTLFAIFILILVYWADILKKYFHPGARRSVPMYTFFALVAALLVFELINLILFLSRVYTTEGMILYNAVLLAVVSLVCVCEITIFSHRFRTVLQTLGAINQVSTDSQVRRIVWITVTGNLFFTGRAILETVFAALLFGYWHTYHSVDKLFSHTWWDTYTLLKYGSELAILALMLWILQSRFSPASGSANGGAAPSQSNNAGYQPVGDAGSATIV
mmetsp:Transcript_18902/g.24310  ORF Transcript_18902/g.24310 Transcript_18902/m.24310 type:complete len:343 (+) Transcript_18902:297-1325(+)|eukprot:CAMPEP_0198143526 /NCGR_PEP_ID=MMETSP1443-20131203/8341_1 /TAXON_ID=186043 /ORGANISM="Entomoneis sp., Strain CCMP2396" /LENGTH=342 /DNA_ID=CAMNT_0043806777 /DNA_START=214 /DNA_END=1242 /DNA_ORIENTATION=-